MKLSQKQKAKLDEKCLNKFGCNFDSMYLFVENIVKDKEKQKALKNQMKLLKR